MKYTDQRTRWASRLGAATLILAPALAAANPPSRPGLPTGTISNNTLVVSWAASSDALGIAGYNVYINDRYTDTVSGTRYESRIDQSRDNSVYVVAFDNRDSSGNRFFSARSPERQFSAQSATGGGNNSDEAAEAVEVTPAPTATTGAGPIPTAPTALNAVRTSPTTVALSWTASVDDEGIVGYNVYRDDRYISTVSNPRLTDIQLAAGTEYSYYVVAFDQPRNFSPRSATTSTAAGNSSTPVVVEVPVVEPTIPTSAPSTPEPTIAEPSSGPDTLKPFLVQNLQATINDNGTVSVRWNAGFDNVGVEGYNLYRNGSYLTTLFQTGFIDRTAPTGETPRYAIAAFDAVRNFSPTTAYVEATSGNGSSANGNPPTLRDPNADPIPSPPSSDPFGLLLEIDNESAVAGGPPTQPKNLRAELVSNDWAEINWAPSNDDGEVVEYRIYRSDGVIYTIREDQTLPNSGNQAEIDRFWNSTIFIDCNYTRFFQLVFIDDFVNVFSDEFDGTEINSNFWNTGLVWGDTRIINGEQQYFVNPQAQPDFGYNPFNLTGDTLKIESIVTPDNLKEKLPPVCDEVDPFGKERCAFLSGALSSHDKFGLTYGYIESRMKVGSGTGSLSSFYLYHRFPGTGRNRHAPEIDIVEYLGENPFGDELAFQTHHYANIADGSTSSAPTMSYANPDGSKFDEDFHTFGVLWEPQLVIWYVDGREIKRMTGPQVGRQQMNIVTYLVSGSAWAPTPDINADIFPLEFEIDYIKAYQRPPFNTNGLYPQ